MKKVFILVCLIGLLVLSGCGGGGGSKSKSDPMKTVSILDKADKVNIFIDALGKQDVEGMLSIIDKNNFKVQYYGDKSCETYVDKTYVELKAELETIIANQKRWSSSHGYNFIINEAGISYNSQYSQWDITATFDITESADGIEDVRTIRFIEFDFENKNLTGEAICKRILVVTAGKVVGFGLNNLNLDVK